MIFWVEDALFEEHATRDVDRIALLRGATNRRHTLIISDSPERLHFRMKAQYQTHFRRWVGGLSEQLQKEILFLEESLRWVSANASTRGAERVHVRVVPREDEGVLCLGFQDAIHLAGLPLSCLVENVVNDPIFLRRCMPPAWREQLEAWEKAGLFQFEHGGGLGNIGQIVKAFGEQDVWRLTHAIVFDHDGKDKNKPSQQSLDLMEEIKKRGLRQRAHRLQRKKQENYIPPQAMQLMSRGGAVTTFLKHDPEERRFREVPKVCKNGFSKFDAKIEWDDAWFDEDGCWPEMKEIAELLAAAM